MALSISVLAVAAAMPGPAGAVDWLGTLDNDWFAAPNWNGGVPNAGVAAIIDTQTPNAAVIDGALANTKELIVGDSATGALTFTNGGIAASEQGYIANTAGSNGTVDLSGSSVWSIADTLRVGGGGTGTLTVSGGSVLLLNNGYIGHLAAGVGMATVSGPGSTVSADQFFVGHGGSGDLTISDKGLVSDTNGVIGALPGGSGTVTVTGAGSGWNSADALSVGYGGTATLSIFDGGAVTSTTTYLGVNATGKGTATVSGSGSTWTTADELHVGSFGSGTVTILSGGVLDTGSNGAFTSYLGELAGGTGELSVSGAGSLWKGSQDIQVGAAGTGTLAVTAGGAVTLARDLLLGAVSSGTGEVTINGSGSSLTGVRDLVVGDLGTGTFTLSGGATASFGDDLIVAQAADSSGTATVTGAGSALIATNSVVVGDSGSGSLSIAAGGTVTFDTGSIGNTVTGAGSVAITGPGAELAGFTLLVGSNGKGAATLADGGKLMLNGGTGLLYLANIAGSEGTLNIGAAAGDAAKAAGVLNLGKVIFGDGAGTLNFNHTETNFAFDVQAAGTGAINQIAGVTRLTANNSGFLGATTVSGGSLIVDSLLGGTVAVTGGTLGGSGNLKDVTIASGGTIAPGNSIGTLHVATAVFDPGSVYAVEVESGGSSDRIAASGAVTLNGGTVNLIAYPDYALDTSYTILTAAGGVAGSFDSASFGGSLFISPFLSYDATSVYAKLQKTAGFESAALTPNQKAAAGGAESLGGGNALYDAVVMLGSQAEAQAAFDGISGEMHASAKTALIEASRFVREAANDRTRSVLGTAGADGEATGSAGVWAQGFGAYGSTAGDGNAAELDRSTGGLFIGADGEAFDGWALGVLAGYSRSSLDAAARASSGDVDSYHLAAYGGTRWQNFALRVGGAYSWHSVDVNRTVAFTGFSDSLASSYSAATGQVFGELGYEFRLGEARFEGFANLAHVSHSTESFQESGGVAALAGTNDTASLTFTTLGIRGETELAIGGAGTAHLTGMIGWRHGFGTITPAQTLALAGGTGFTVFGAPVGRDALLLETGMNFDLSASASLGLSYSGLIGSGLSDHAFKANLGVKF
ncbi:autotransporter outer membrane beta-barrel domain-containing protein [Hoeflea olei]|uniref:Autotransporter domain-containing protein n=1 Tax=Hoeflea olei TaxID=1480615 RepID=A0A1C1YYJ8_9HYPH|nr:autotransporter domain-containing protein [Hoeflea olei]OCW58552.1 hypothetical protein AWJ14_05230 [Hoeflea olei]